MAQQQAQAEAKALREQSARADATPTTSPMRPDGLTMPTRAERAAAAKVEPRLAAALSGAEETELDIPAFLRHPLRNNAE
jgi:hypothetical protein